MRRWSATSAPIVPKSRKSSARARRRSIAAKASKSDRWSNCSTGFTSGRVARGGPDLARLVLSEPSQADLEDIWTHIAQRRTNEIADAVLARIYGAMGALAYAPRIGRVCREFPDNPRSFAVQPHVIF